MVAGLLKASRHLVLDVGRQLICLALSSLSSPPPLAAVERSGHGPGKLPALLPLLVLDNLFAAFAVPALLELLAELLVEGQGLVGLLLGLALVVVILIVRVNEIRLVIVAVLDKASRFQADGALVAGLVPGLGARVSDAAGDGQDNAEGHGEEEHHDAGEGDKIFVHVDMFKVEFGKLEECDNTFKGRAKKV